MELWAKWCGPCRQVFPHLTAIYKSRQGKGLSVVGVSIEDDPSLDAFVAKEGDRMGYTVAVDQGGTAQQLMQRAGVSGIPHAFVVDRTGTIAHRCGLCCQQTPSGSDELGRCPEGTVLMRQLQRNCSAQQATPIVSTALRASPHSIYR